MVETLLFPTSEEMAIVLEKLQATFPTIRLISRSYQDSAGFPIVVDLGAIDQRTWCQWAIENEVFTYCTTLVMLSLDPPEWMRLVLQAQRLKKQAKRLTQS